jgi:hypothetical protein
MMHLQGSMPRISDDTYYISSDQWHDALEIELGPKVLFDLYHSDKCWLDPDF